MAHLINVKPTHVSYVDKAANRRTILMTKSEDENNYEKVVKFIKGADNEEKKLVYAVVYEPDVKDTDDDEMTADEIEKACHEFMMSKQQIDTQHNFVGGAGQLMESYIAPTDFKIGEQLVTKGTWVMVTKATDEIWEGIQSGKITGISMAGTAERVQDEPTISKSFLEKCVGAVMKTLNIKKESGDIFDMTPDELKKLIVDSINEELDKRKENHDEGGQRKGDGNENDDKQKLDLTDAQAKYLADEQEKIGKSFTEKLEKQAKEYNDRLNKIEKSVSTSRGSNVIEQIAKNEDDDQPHYMKTIFGED